jgi:hypothetical protein
MPESLWSALAERSGDGAFGMGNDGPEFCRVPSKSGVALRLPPHSKISLMPTTGVLLNFWAWACPNHCGVRRQSEAATALLEWATTVLNSAAFSRKAVSPLRSATALQK